MHHYNLVWEYSSSVGSDRSNCCPSVRLSLVHACSVSACLDDRSWTMPRMGRWTLPDSTIVYGSASVLFDVHGNNSLRANTWHMSLIAQFYRKPRMTLWNDSPKRITRAKR